MSNIKVELTDENEFHCFKIIFFVKNPEAPDGDRIPMEINLHTTQAIELQHQLAVQLAEFMRRSSAELLRIKSAELAILSPRCKSSAPPH